MTGHPSHIPRLSRRRGIALVLGVALAALAGSAIGPASSLIPSASAEETERIVIPEEKFGSQAKSESSEAGEEAIEAGRRFNFEGFRSQLLGLWYKRKAFVQKNLPEAAAEQTEAIQHLCGEVGVTRLDDIAAALVHEGQGFLEEGNFEKARRSFQDALKFAPDMAGAHFGLATASWRSDAGLSDALAALTAGTGALLHNSPTSSAVLGNMLIILILAAAVTAILFSIAMLLRYQLLVRHDLSERLALRYPHRYTKEAIGLLGWTVLLFPLLTWFAALWTPAYWLALTFRYQKAREKAISAALLMLLILSAPAARAAEVLFGLAADPSARLMLASTSASYDPEMIVTLEQKAATNPQDPAYRFLLGNLYARGRYFQEALAQYHRVIELDPRSYRALNNLGNIFLRTGRPEEAAKYYKSALGLRADFLPSYYNTYLARKENLRLKEAEAVLHQGQAIDAEALSSLIAEARLRGPGEPIDAVVSHDEVFRRILGEGGGRGGIASSLASLPSIMAAAFLIAALLLVLLLGKRHALRCARCGEAFCHRCKVGTQVPDYCTQCQQLAVARDALAPAMRREKVSQSERFRAAWVRLSRLTSVIFPGMGRLLDGRTLTGVLISAAWSGAILALLMRPRLLQFSGVGGTRPLILVTILLTLLASAAWVLGNLRPARQADAPAGGWQWR